MSTPTSTVDLTRLSGEEIRLLFADEMGDGDAEIVADEVGIAANTVRRLKSGDTQKPDKRSRPAVERWLARRGRGTISKGAPPDPLDYVKLKVIGRIVGGEIPEETLRALATSGASDAAKREVGLKTGQAVQEAVRRPKKPGKKKAGGSGARP